MSLSLGRWVGSQKGSQPQLHQPVSSFSAGPPWETRPNYRFLFRVGEGGALRAPAPGAVPALQSGGIFHLRRLCLPPRVPALTGMTWPFRMSACGPNMNPRCCMGR